ncbi:hypothetical protein H4219_001874 [Mycoemilia scoparia]|uniref:Uncharacterized protein n=1 Tax=Mycoemilia scoparia TaxID=417184 RepID=A0A9W8DPV5_9FUNG|nr:hypothetical protein H4219_001874 [Mycoemilia scoparia]
MLSGFTLILATLATLQVATPQNTDTIPEVRNSVDFGGDDDGLVVGAMDSWEGIASALEKGFGVLRTDNPELYSHFVNVYGSEIPSTPNIGWFRSVQNADPSDVAGLSQALSTLSNRESYLESVFGSMPTGFTIIDDDVSGSATSARTSSDDDDDDDDNDSEVSDSVTSGTTSRTTRGDSDDDDSSETSDSEDAASGLKLSAVALAGSLIAFNALF